MLEAMRKISPEAFDLSLSRGQSLNPFMATLSSGAISSQQQSMLPFLNNSPHPLPILNNGLRPLPFFTNSLHLLPLSNSNLHPFPTNSLPSLPNTRLDPSPCPWMPSRII